MRKAFRWKALLIGLSGTVAPLGGALAAEPDHGMSAPAGQCSVAAIQALSPADTTITSATPTSAPVPHCRIDGYVTTDDPIPNRNLFRLQLPDTGWTGRYYFIGLGAAAGYVPTDSQVPAGNPLYGGFAVAGTDTGHEGPMLDWSFMGRNKAQAIDHVHRGAHVVAVATQNITRKYYHASTMYRYHSGCSGGGRMGVMAIERHPEDYDGMLLGAPGGRSSATMIKFISAAQEMTREPGAWLSPAKLAMTEKKVTAACDATDGAVDGVVADHRLCHFDVATLACKSGDGPDCLTGPEIRSMKAIMRGPIGPDGKPLTEGMPITDMTVWSGFIGKTPPPWTMDPNKVMRGEGNAGLVIADTLAKSYFGPNYDALTQFDSRRQADVDAWRAAAIKLDYGEPYTANISGFQKDGGKLILWNGVSDPCCSDVEMEQYYRDAAKFVTGGMAAMPDFVRFYRVPGTAHCGGGSGPGDAPDQLLKALVAWVEHGQPPGEVVAHRGADRVQMAFAAPGTKMVSGVIIPPPAGPPRDFVLCPFPQTAVLDKSRGPGAAEDARNWSCRAPDKVAAAR